MSTPPGHYICRICNIPGHWIQKCPLKNQNQVPSYYICKICKRPGHFIRNCPLKYDPILSRIPSNYICHKCGYPGHWIQNCSIRYNNHTNIPPVNYVCNKCGKQGHWIKDCEEQYSTTPPSNYLCRICQIPGHWIEQCPNRVSADHLFNDISQRSPQVVTCITTKSDLINGYIRRIEKLFQQNASYYKIIPFCINQIIDSFYIWSCGSYLATNDEHKDGKWHRIYYEANHPTNKDPIITMKIPEISDRSYAMRYVTTNNTKLLFLDISIPWSISAIPGLEITFFDREKRMTSTLLLKDWHGMVLFSDLQLAVSSTTSIEIIRHLLDNVDPYDSWNSYCFLKLVIKNLACATTEFDKIWNDQYAELIREPILENVHKMQLLKSFDMTSYRDAKCIFNIVRGCVMETDTPLLQHGKYQKSIGIDVFDSFYEDFRKITNVVTSHLIDNGDRFCIVICLNFFEYFQDLKMKHDDDHRELVNHSYMHRFSDYEIEGLFWAQYDRWIDNHLMDLLEVDLRISKLRPRQYCMEHFALKFCKTMKENEMDGTTKMLEILMRMKELELLNGFMDQILKAKDLLQCISYLLGDEKINHTSIWTQFRELVDKQYVTAIIDSGKLSTE